MTSPILITGAGQRIGLALAKHLRSAGQKVIITYRTRHSSIDELESLGITCLPADFKSNETIFDFIATLKSHTQSLKAIIHNASSWDCEANNPDSADLFDNMMRIHAKAPYLINLNCADLLIAHQNNEHTPADIIHLTDYVVETGSPKHLAYAASKAALDNLTRSFSAKFASQIKVNSVAPSLIIFNQDDDEAYRKKTLKKSLMGIEPGCQEIINSVELLLNSHYITGRSIPVDGGRHLK
ncbi:MULTISPECIES: dihydromonapterin reductase [unclassified Pseudoalteromonas]|uniref:dihydromonapterin reductase n=1 Tax=unclassified Pseudoalteromonas TaxID=194690 RepID=UPI0025B3727D|nr:MULTISPECIES: dihydromonapterin reductase [unclassified Pseudoalteromonas]MDN3378796.1 dihydromonapterin reductase [Pseudoalteromonas sp. APC 3893]MDN3387284.1 dihydromonapterin reductase [Pseudoalteromonas sp. APC 4017]